MLKRKKHNMTMKCCCVKMNCEIEKNATKTSMEKQKTTKIISSSLTYKY